MSLVSRGCAPIAVNRPKQTGCTVLDSPVPIGTVASRLHRFYAFSNQINSSSEGPDTAERERANTAVASHIFVFHNCGRDNHDKEYAQKFGIRPPILPQPSSCRKSFSMGHLCNKFGLTEIHSSSGQHLYNAIRETRFNPTHTHLPIPNDSEIQPFTNPLLLKELQNPPLVSSSLRHTPDIERWRSARDMFTQYHISRPSGWLSDIQSGDGNASPRGYCRYCHICSIPTLAPTHCSSCGHRLCEKCKCEVSSGTPQAHANFSHPSSPTIARDGSQYASASRTDPEFMERLSQNRNNDRVDTQLHRPFDLRPDTSWRKNEGRGKETTFAGISLISSNHSRMNEEQPEQNRSQSTRPIKKNPFVVKDQEDKKQGTGHPNQKECDDPLCRATHTGHYPFRHSVSCSKHGSEQSRQSLDPGGVSNKPPQAVVGKSNLNESFVPDERDVPHRHHSSGFHSHHHIAEHLSSAIGHNAYDLLEGRKAKVIEPISSKASIKRSPCLQPLTKPKPVTRIGSFQWTQDAVPPGHPGRSGDERQQQFPMTEVATIASNGQPHKTANDETTRNARDTASDEATIHDKQKETQYDLNVSWRDKEPHKLRLVSPTSWLRNPTKTAADATAPLHHVNTKSNEAHGSDHEHVPKITVDDRREHATALSTNAVHKVDTPEERRLPPIRTHNSSSLVAKVPESSHVTPKIQIDRAPSEHKRRYIPVSVSKRREAFEYVQDHTSTASSTMKASHIRKTLPQQEAKDTHLRSNTRLDQEKNATPRLLDARLRRGGTGKSFISTTHGSDQELEPKFFAEHSSEPEIAKPTPIAPPNHECDWKERYLVLTAEIRQLKAEMSTRASLKSSDTLTPRYEQHRDNLDLLGVTVILHSRDRDDIVINTDATRDAGPSNY
ncbi:hypothetical protein F4801DRAFT_577879 [Xylaria longipes]|nr:hypothetical protein F4801DRAFT_577879 [Xylaria longipes]